MTQIPGSWPHWEEVNKLRAEIAEWKTAFEEEHKLRTDDQERWLKAEKSLTAAAAALKIADDMASYLEDETDGIPEEWESAKMYRDARKTYRKEEGMSEIDEAREGGTQDISG